MVLVHVLFILLDQPFGLVVPKSPGSFSQATALLFDALAQTAQGRRVHRGPHHLWHRDACRPPQGTCLPKARLFFITCAGDSKLMTVSKRKELEGPCVLPNCVANGWGHPLVCYLCKLLPLLILPLLSPGCEKVNVKGMDEE